MNILLYIDTFIQESETFIDNHINWLVKDHKVVILCEQKITDPKYDITIIELGKNRKTPISKFKSFIQNRIRLDFFNLEWENKISEIISHYQIDLIHCHFGIQGLKLADNYSGDLPLIFTFHGYDISKWIYQSRAYRKRLQKLFRTPNFHAILVCKYHLKILKDFGFELNDNYSIIYNGVNVNLFTPNVSSFRKRKEAKFLQVSRFVEKKGHAFTLEAFAKFKNHNPNIQFKLCFVGDGPLLKNIIEQSKILNLENEVFFYGWKSQKDLVKIYNESDIYIQHSVASKQQDMEATSITILEAMAMQLPILSTYHAGIPEVVEDGINGLLVKERDIEEYSKAIFKIHSWNKLERNRKKIIENFSLQKNQYLISNIYKKLVQMY